MPAIGQLGVDAISAKPGGSSATLSPWLIQTFSIPWPSSVLKSSMPSSRRVWPCAHFRVTEFAVVAPLDLAAELHGHRLLP